MSDAARLRGGFPAALSLGDREFAQLRALIERESGIHLTDAKRALLVGRLTRRLRELGLTSFGAYHRLVLEDATGVELTRLLDLISTNETRFFREPTHFELLERSILPAIAAAAARGERPREVRVWSAACSTGEEPYSLAMCLLDAFPPGEGFTVEVLASDLSTRVLERARAGIFSLERAADIPERHLRRFMLRGTGSQHGRMKAADELRAVVRFQRTNLIEPGQHPSGPFDLVFCRNVLIYFQTATRAAVIDSLLSRLRPGGHLFLGHAETLGGKSDRVRSVGPNVYARLPPDAETSRRPRREAT